MILEHRWLGTEGAAFERVALAFEGLGFVRPVPDENTSGAYALDIAGQYRGNLTQAEAFDVITFALNHNLAYMKVAKLSLAELRGYSKRLW